VRLFRKGDRGAFVQADPSREDDEKDIVVDAYNVILTVESIRSGKELVRGLEFSGMFPPYSPIMIFLMRPGSL
jgi:hypothetical protein